MNRHIWGGRPERIRQAAPSTHAFFLPRPALRGRSASGRERCKLWALPMPTSSWPICYDGGSSRAVHGDQATEPPLSARLPGQVGIAAEAAPWTFHRICSPAPGTLGETPALRS